jgi:hypothetical protein
MATVLVAVLMLAGSIWIAIRMEAGLDRPVTRPGDPVRGLRSCELRCVRVTVGHAYPVRPARCRLHHGAANHATANHGTANSGVADPAATRPARCSDSAVIHGVRPMHEPVAYPERARA